MVEHSLCSSSCLALAKLLFHSLQALAQLLDLSLCLACTALEHVGELLQFRGRLCDLFLCLVGVRLLALVQRSEPAVQLGQELVNVFEGAVERPLGCLSSITLSCLIDAITKCRHEQAAHDGSPPSYGGGKRIEGFLRGCCRNGRSTCPLAQLMLRRPPLPWGR